MFCKLKQMMKMNNFDYIPNPTVIFLCVITASQCLFLVSIWIIFSLWTHSLCQVICSSQDRQSKDLFTNFMGVAGKETDTGLGWTSHTIPFSGTYPIVRLSEMLLLLLVVLRAISHPPPNSQRAFDFNWRNLWLSYLEVWGVVIGLYEGEVRDASEHLTAQTSCPHKEEISVPKCQ